MHKKFLNFWRGRRERFYRRQKWHLVLDFSLMLILIILAGVSIRLVFYSPGFINIMKLAPSYLTPEPSQSTDLNFEIKAEPVKSVLKMGEKMTWQIKLSNTGTREIKELRLQFAFKSAAFDISSIETEEDFEIKGSDIIVSDIGTEETRDINLSLLWQSVQSNAPRSLELTLNAISFDAKNNKLEKNIILTPIKISSDFKLEADLFYHSLQGDQLGVGPIPPIVGIPTKYWLIVKAENYGNNLKNLVFSAQLAPEVELAEDYSLLAGKFSYDENRRLLIWQLSSLEAGGGDYIANFALNLIPRENQVDKNALILKNIQYHVDDEWTGLEIENQLPALDSSLPLDRLNRGQGIVSMP